MSVPAYEVLSEKRCFGGVQGFYRFISKACDAPIRFGVFHPDGRAMCRHCCFWPD
jgi:hypothetical protein